MSRIHDAIKKAEREGTTWADEADRLQPSSQSPAGSVEDAVVGGSTLFTQPSTAPLANEGVSFDEVRMRCAHQQWHPNPILNVFANPLFSTAAAEEFRTLRSRLYQVRSSQPLHAILITSSVVLEGKTFTAHNLAQAIVRQPERRVLMIDADLRCPRLHTMLGAPASPGLSDYLRGSADEFAVIQHGNESNLYFIASGTDVHNPSELLSNGRLRNLLDRVGSAFDWVIFDSPPCLPIADARVIADFCDGALLVTRAASTPAGVVQRAVQELQARKTVIGVVLNAVETSAPGYKSYEKGPQLVQAPEQTTSRTPLAAV